MLYEELMTIPFLIIFLMSVFYIFFLRHGPEIPSEAYPVPQSDILPKLQSSPGPEILSKLYPVPGRTIRKVQGNVQTPAIGIDFGTTTSCVAAYQNGKVETFRNRSNMVASPSIVAFTDREELIGELAAEQAIYNAKNTVFDIKRLIGKTYEELMEDKKDWPFVIINVSGKPQISVQYKGSSEQFSPEEICSRILLSLKNIAEEYMERDVRDAVITIPPYFNDAQRHAMMEAGRLAGLNVLRIIHEPTAAAIAHSFNKQDEQEKIILVFHLGGGTLNVAVLETQANKFHIMGSDGYTQFGGKEFDKRIVQHLIDEFEHRFERELSDDEQAIHTLRIASEKAKRELSEKDNATIEINSLYQGIDFYTKLSRKKFEELCDDLFQKIKVTINNALRYAHLEKRDIKEVLLVGGMTHVPEVKETIRKYFPSEIVISHTVQGNDATVHGAAIWAAILNKNVSNVLPPIEYFERVELSKGICIAHGRMKTIIKRSSFVPCKETLPFTTFFDEQTSLMFEVYEGERPLVRDNHYLGKFTIKNIPLAHRRGVSVDVTFEIDDNGILYARAKERNTGTVVSLDLDRLKFRTGTDALEMVVKAEEENENDSSELARIESRFNLDDCAHDMLSRIKYDNMKTRTSAESIDRINRLCNGIITWLSTNQDETKAVYDQKKSELEDLWNSIVIANERQ